jgi:hypothetical protein
VGRRAATIKRAGPIEKANKMANPESGNPISFIHDARSKTRAFENGRKCLAVALLFVVMVKVGWAQEIDSSALQAEATAPGRKTQADARIDPAQAAPTQATPPQPPPNSGLSLPAGTKLALGLLRPLTVKPGRDVYLQVTFPVTAAGQMLIPPGVYIQGVVGKIIRKDRRSLQFEISSAHLIFSNGYTVAIGGTVTVGTVSAATAPQSPAGNGQPVPAMSALGSVAPPPLPPLPSLGNGPRNAIIGVGVAAVVGTTILFVVAHGRNPQIEVGTPLEIILPAPVFLDAARVAAAVQQYDQQSGNAPPQIVQPPLKPKMCYDAGSPGTPDTVIPGTPGTPASRDFPGTPGTPDTVIPGTPGTPSSEYPCPK